MNTKYFLYSYILQLDVHITGVCAYLNGTAPFSVVHWTHPKCEECKIREATSSTSKGNCFERQREAALP